MKQRNMFILVWIVAALLLQLALVSCDSAPEKPAEPATTAAPAESISPESSHQQDSAGKTGTSTVIENKSTPDQSVKENKPEDSSAKDTKTSSAVKAAGKVAPQFSEQDVYALVEKKVFAPEKAEMPKDRTPFKYGEHDLNGDGKAELFVLIQDPYFCGSGGCTAFLFSADGKKLSRFTVSEPPVFVSEKKTNGWNDLIITSKGVQHVMVNDGKKYPLNPSVQPQISRDQIEKTARAAAEKEEIYVQDGHNLRIRSLDELPLLSPFEEVRFVFDHHGDPDTVYSIDVRIEDGKAVVMPDTTFD